MPMQLDTRDIAASAFRAFSYAGGVQDEPEWDKLDSETQLRWLHLAKHAEGTLQAMEDKPYQQAAAGLAALWAKTDDPAFFETFSKRLQIIWQAVTRHLMTLLDCDDVDSPEPLERSWGEWVDSKLRGEP